MADLTFGIKATSENPTKTLVKVRQFSMIVDEPAALGGTDEGANPVEYLLASFSGCLNVVCHMMAKEMNFELRNLELELEGDLNPAKFQGISDKERTGFKEIRVRIKADTDADAATLEKWTHAVESRCPVSDNISNATPVRISLA